MQEVGRGREEAVERLKTSYRGLSETGATLLTRLANLFIKIGYAEGLAWGALAEDREIQRTVLDQV